MFDEILSLLVKGRYEKVAAQLRGYTRLTVKGDVYPGLLRSAKGRVEGIVIKDITADDLRILDQFEGVYYKRDAVVVYCKNRPIKVETYVTRLRFRHILSASQWEPGKFRNRYLHSFRDRFVDKSG